VTLGAGDPSLSGRASTRSSRPGHILWVFFLCWCAGAALTAFARRAPEPVPANAPARVFSQARAHRILQLVAGDSEPRTPGSDASERTLARLATELEHLGLASEHQRTFVCAAGSCAHVHNLLARIDGAEPGCVLLVAHHDSVGAGPGASDDGVGVAVIFETLRALRAGPPLRHGVIALIDDAEEIGSLGATAFATEHAWMNDVAAVINVDNGGTTGLGLLYGTGPGNLAVIDLYSNAVRHAATSSVLAVAQQYLPRFSDFGVFQREGLPGANFAFAGGETRYHTTLDTVALADPGSIQHEGDSVLAVARALSASNLDALVLVAREGVWFDLFGAVVIRWPAAWSLALSILTIAFLAFAAWRERLQLGAAALACGLAFCAPVLSGALAAALQWLLAWIGLIPATFVAEPGWLFAALSSLALLCVVVASRVLARFDPRSVAIGVWFAWTGSAVATSIALPGASVLFLPVMLMAAGVYALVGRTSHGMSITHAVAALGSAAVWFPGLALAPETFGISTLIVFAMPAAWLASLLLPALAALDLRSHRALGLIAAGSLLLTLAAHGLTPKFDARSPQRVNVIAYSDASARRSFAIVDTSWIGPRAPVPRAMSTELARLAKREPYEASPFEWRETPALIAPLAETDEMSAPVIHVVSSNAGEGVTTLRVELGHAVRRFSVVARASAPIRALRLGVHSWPAVVQPGRGGVRYRTWSLYAPERDATLHVEWDSAQREQTELLFVGESAGVPDALRALLNARPSSASASQSGDRTIVSARLRL
jgi:hypothetical protein